MGSGDGNVGPGSDAAPGDTVDAGPMFTGPCGSTGAIRDNFDDGVIDNEWRASGMVTETGGVLGVTPNSSTTFSGYETKHHVDLTGTNVAVEVPQMLDTSSTATAALYLVADTTHYLAITQTNGTLNAEWDTGSGVFDAATTYDPTNDRWWRISEAGGNVTFEVSADGATFTPLTSIVSPPWITNVEIALGGYSDGVITHGTVQFDNLDDKLDLAGWCKADTFGDHFMRNTVGFDWTARKTPTAAAGCTPTVMNGAHFDQSGLPNSRCWLASSHAYDLVNSYAFAQVGPITGPAKPGWTAFLRAISDNVADAMLIEWDTGMVCAQVRSDPPICRAYDMGNDAYWRIREAGGMVVFDTSKDAVLWTPIASVPVPFPLNALEIQIGTEATTSFAGNQPLVVDSYEETN